MIFVAFKPSEFSIINADAHSDFDIEKKLTLRDQRDRKLDVKLNYVYLLFLLGYLFLADMCPKGDILMLGVLSNCRSTALILWSTKLDYHFQYVPVPRVPLSQQM
jgi:hypothetical protein